LISQGKVATVYR